MSGRRKLRTRPELEAEYDALVNLDLSRVGGPDQSFEKAALIHCLQWVLWGNGTRPTDWLAHKGNTKVSVQCEHDFSYAVYPAGKCRKCGAHD